jgi:hypothetical protein
MSRDNYETIWEFRTRRFLVTLDVAPEDSDPADSFSCQADIDAVRNGELEWFIARVTVRLSDGEGDSGFIIGADYLGSCAYKTFVEFRESHFHNSAVARNTLHNKARGITYIDYFPSMVAEAVQAARANLSNLKLRAPK